MLIPPVNLEQDQSWFADKLQRQNIDIAPADIDEIDLMEPRAFERWALSRCVALGWQASRTPVSHDGGADGLIVHRSTGARAVVQCKHKQATDACGPELRARGSYGDINRLFVLTNADKFSRTAHDRAEKYGIRLIDRNQLVHWPQQLIQ